ncbi:hypothetical protein ECB98_20340 [Brucellaceae bacterium VT-16-1752]|nr:hypothetical protein ECB98_20340 [Brucellaceae bacterium VT-16-1752]
MGRRPPLILGRPIFSCWRPRQVDRRSQRTLRPQSRRQILPVHVRPVWSFLYRFHEPHTSKAIHVLDGLLYHGSELSIEFQYIDAGSVSDMSFALCHLVGS